MNVKIFNTLLRGAAKNADLQTFAFILHLMLHRNIQPNAETWIAFLMAVPDLRIKLHVFQRMHNLGLLRYIGTKRKACEQIVILEVNASLDNAQTQEQFLSHMDSRYGPSWLKVSSGNRIIHALAARGLISRSWSFLQVMEDRVARPNVVTINTILNHCKQSGNINGAIQLMKNLPPSIKFVRNDYTYRILFELAWRGKCYNLAKVVWRYACLEAATTHSMRLRIATSLIGAIPRLHEPGNSARQYFGHSAGLFIGIFEHLKDHPTAVYSRKFAEIYGFNMIASSAELRGDDDTDSTVKSESIPSNDSNHVRLLRNYNLTPAEFEASTFLPTFIAHSSATIPGSLRSVYRRFERRECEVFQMWQPARPFAEMLVEAWEMDLNWKNPGDDEMGKEMAKLSWKLANAITIPLKADINDQRIDILWK